VEVHRELVLLRLDGLLRAAWERVDDGDVRAIDSAPRITDAQVKLLGLDRVDRGQPGSFYTGFGAPLEPAQAAGPNFA
jgi:hypothetical protein